MAPLRMLRSATDGDIFDNNDVDYNFNGGWKKWTIATVAISKMKTMTNLRCRIDGKIKFVLLGKVEA